MLNKIYCSECGKEITEGHGFITYTDPDSEKNIYACDRCNKKVYSAS